MRTKLQEAQALADALSAWAGFVEHRYHLGVRQTLDMELRHLRALRCHVEWCNGRWVS